MDIKYKIEFPAGEEAVNRIATIFTANKNPKDIQHLRWQYLQLPSKKKYCAFAVDDTGKDAANYNLFVVKAKINGVKDREICQSLDTLTDQNHRGKGLFIGLAKEIYKDCDKAGINAIYGFPNSSSGPGFFKKLDWSSFGYPSFIFYLNNLFFPISFITKKKCFYLKNIFFSTYLAFRRWKIKSHNYKIVNTCNFDKQYENLWNKFSSDINTCVWRDSEYMIWRYKQKPNKKYRYLSIYDKDQLKGVIISTLETKHGGKIGYVMDLIYDKDNDDFGEILINFCLKDMIHNKVDLILTWSQKEYTSHSLYRNSLFFNLPRKFQPIKLFFGYRKNMLTKEKIDSFYITYSDSDTV